MKIPQIQEGLKRLFDQEQQRIVFWYDSGAEFQETLSSLELEDVTLLRRDEIADLEVKIRLEQEDLTGRYLLYAPTQEPPPEENWLLDIQLYSRCFYADRVSIWLDELKLEHHSLRSYLNQRTKFLCSQNRFKALKKLVHAQDQEAELDLKILTVLIRADQADIFALLLQLLSAFCEKDPPSLDLLPKAWESIEKMGMASSFWSVIEQHFGYSETPPLLKNFLIRLFVTEFHYHFEASSSLSSRASDSKDPLVSLKHLYLTQGPSTANSVILLSQWRESMKYFQAYESLSSLVAEEIQLMNILDVANEDSLLKIMSFECVEQRIITGLRDQLISEPPHSRESFQSIIATRREGHWANPLLAEKEGSKQKRYQCIYKAIESASELFSLQDQYREGFAYASAEEMAQAYVTKLFRFDQLYRLFHEEEGKVLLEGGDILKALKEKIEHSYSQCFLPQLAQAWGSFLEKSKNPTQSLLNQWKLNGVTNQYQFFKSQVAPILKNSASTKIYVIISDAFRYEAAEELTRHLNQKHRFKAKLGVQLGVLPSYTSLGMASLLPHKKLSYKLNKNAEVWVDEMPTSSLEQRKKILEAHEGTAIKANVFMNMKRDEGRAFAKAHRIIYIYHDTIDAVGDKFATEDKSFDAVREAIQELSALVKHIVNTLNGTQLLITADHGFLFQESKLSLQDRSVLEEKPEGTLKAKKRYLLGTQLSEHPKVWHGSTSNTANAEGGMEFWIPKGANRFHFTGGARFVHGGAMLQEIMVPIVSIKQLRGEEAKRAKARKVDISLLGAQHKITTNRHRLELVQTEAICEGVLPRSLSVGLWSNETLISNEETLSFSSDSSSMEQRKKSVSLLLKSGNYDTNKEYHLLMRDVETKAEYQRVSFSINLAFSNDF